MRILLCTGSGGGGSALVAAATAAILAQSGQKTMLTTPGPVDTLSALLGIPLTDRPQPIAPNLDAWVLDTPGELRVWFDYIRSRASGTMTQLSSDELPLIPGMEFFLCIARLQQMEAAGYTLAVVDAGPQDALLRMLTLPDSFRWFVRLMFGLDRNPGRNPSSVARAVVPSSLIPFDWVGQVQEARAQLEQARAAATASDRMALRYVLRPDRAALEEARLAVGAFHLHGVAMDALVVGPLLPPDGADASLRELVAQQEAIANEAEDIWHMYPTLRLPLTPFPGSVEDVQALGQTLYSEHWTGDLVVQSPPIKSGERSDPFFAIHLPGIQPGALHLTLSGDELIVQIGPYRRHVLLPDTLRGRGGIRANCEGEWLVVRLRR